MSVESNSKKIWACQKIFKPLYLHNVMLTVYQPFTYNIFSGTEAIQGSDALYAGQMKSAFFFFFKCMYLCLRYPKV